MSWFGKDTIEAVGTTVESIGGAVTSTIDSINYALSGDLPPDVRVKLEELKLKMQEVDLKISQGQVELNKIEAQSPSFFKSAWRPAIGWIGVIGLFYQFLVHPILEWWILVTNKTQTFGDVTIPMSAPILNTDGIMALVVSMLGIGGYRTYEKFKGVTK